MPSQPSQNKKSSRKKIVSVSDAIEDPNSTQPSASGTAASHPPKESKSHGASGSVRKQGAKSNTASNWSQRQASSAEQRPGNPPGATATPDSRHARKRTGEGARSVGARIGKQMEPGKGHSQEEVFTATGHCEPFDSSIRRPKYGHPARTFTNSSLSGGMGRGVVAGWTKKASSQYPGGFGPPIPDDVLNDICFRFLINIPEEEKSNVIRTCFQVELAHWFYIDFYCKGDHDSPKCAEIGLKDFIRQIFNHCDFLSEFSGRVDEVIEQWREYKSSVPTYGAILLDSSLNYVLLVQGYYARNSWGFPKGKVNENEEPTACAAREVLEEVGYDTSEQIRDNTLIQKFINETLTRLYIVTDVPTDFPFAPRTRNEIGKIQWFSVWDLPTDRNNQKACEHIGLVPNNFYTVMPFVHDLQAYIVRQHNKRNKSKPKMVAPLSIGSARSASAFDPVLPHQKLEFMPSVFTPLFPFNLDSPLQNPNSGSVPSLVTNRSSSPSSAFFKPLSACTHPLSFTGPSFMQLLSNAPSTSNYRDEFVRPNAVARPVATVPKPSAPPLGRPVYEVCKRQHADRKSTSVEVKEEVAVQSHEGVRTKETSAQRRARRLRNRKSERETDSEENTVLVDVQPVTTALPLNRSSPSSANEPLIHLCEAWSNFKLDVSRLFVEVK